MTTTTGAETTGAGAATTTGAAGAVGRSRTGAVTGAVIDEGATRVSPIDTFGMGGTDADDAGGAVGGAGNDDAVGAVGGAGNDDDDDWDARGAAGGRDTTAGGATVATVAGGKGMVGAAAGAASGIAGGTTTAGLGRASIDGGARGPGRRRMDGGWVGAATGAAAARGRPHSRHVVAVPGFLAPQVGQNIVVGLVRCATVLKSGLALPGPGVKRRWHP